MKFRLIAIAITSIIATHSSQVTAQTQLNNRTKRRPYKSQIVFKNTKRLIEKIYKNTKNVIVKEEKLKITTQGGAPTYGEILYESAETLLKGLNLNSKSVLYDLGSGLGKFTIQAHLTTPAKKVVGIELSKTRLNESNKVLTKLRKSKILDPSRIISLCYGNIAKETVSDATAIYMCSTCYSQELMQKILTNLSKLRVGLKVLTLKSLPANPYFRLIKTYDLPMTWSQGSPVQLYVLESNPPKTTDHKRHS